MRIRTVAGLTLAAALSVPGALGAGVEAGQAAAQPQAWKGTVAAGGVIEIKGVNGDVKAVPATAGEVEVSAEMRGRRSNPADVRLDIVQHAEGVTICAVYPSVDGVPNTCEPGDGGRMRVRDNDVRVTFTVRVPAGVRFAGRTVNGSVSAENLGAAITAETVNGDITFATAAYGSAKTVNGEIRGSLGSSDWTGPLAFKTVNGSISLDLPAGTNTDVRATTVNGSISTDFAVTTSGTVNRRQLRGTIGSGGRELEIGTVNGSVTLKRM